MLETASETAAPAVRRKRSRVGALVFLAAGVILATDALWIEPFHIEVTHYEVHAPVSAPLKIAHLTDIHTNGQGRRERRLFQLFADEKPDVIVIAGDTISTLGGGYAEVQELYQQMHAPLGVWVVRGNCENARPVHRERAFYEDAGVHLLVNGNHPLRPDVWIVGLDDLSSGTPRLDAALSGVPPGVFTIALFHSPAFFDRAAGHVNLCLAGHTHGGQVRFPFLPPLWLPKGCGKYLEGWYQEDGSKMYVSRGLGMSVLPVRFLSRPEVTFITVEP
ncbi:MAG: metallophosphoesterase [Candidatus Acidiferrales bacterium]